MSNSTANSLLVALLLMLPLAHPALAQASSSGNAKQQAAGLARKAQQHLMENRPDLAIPDLRSLVALDPENLDARANLGVLLYFKGDYAEAMPNLREALKLKPDAWKIQDLLGSCEKHTGDFKGAAADLASAFTNLDEKNIRVQAGLELIEVYTVAQDLDKAVDVVAILRQIAPTDPRVLYAAYRIHTDLAGEAMLDLSIAAPASGQMYQAMAHELYHEGDLPGTIADLRKAIAADPSLPGIHYELGEALHASPDLKLRAEAEQEYKLALVENNRDEKAMSRLGDIAVEKNDLDEAAADYKKALAIVPNYPDAMLGLAQVDIEKEQPAKAVALLQPLVAADPTNVLAHYRLSVAYRKLKRPDDAKREIEAYQKYKDIKEKMRKVYKGMRQDAPQDQQEK
ncbi:MAG: tetratricopeptide repeat protein [Acidobacteriaceae bacterium]